MDILNILTVSFLNDLDPKVILGFAIFVCVVVAVAFALGGIRREGYVPELPNAVDLANHLGGESQLVNAGPSLVAALSGSDVGMQMDNPYCEHQADELNVDGGNLEEAWNPLA